MVHYHNGKQVPAEFNGGANVVHSHKNCLEWYAAFSNIIQDYIRKVLFFIMLRLFAYDFYFTKGLLMSTSKMTTCLTLQLSWLEVKGSNVLAVELKVLPLDALR
jgi:hypothetical protein